jgi:uncharacterized membrane protein YhhN
MKDVDNNHLNTNSAAHLDEAATSSNPNEKSKLWLVVAFLLINAMYHLFLIAYWRSFYFFTVLCFCLSVLAAMGLIFSKYWDATLLSYYALAFFSILGAIIIAVDVLQSAQMPADLVITVFKILAATAWITLWIIVGVYMRHRFLENTTLNK